jgi:hypothetical protein
MYVGTGRRFSVSRWFDVERSLDVERNGLDQGTPVGVR